MRPGGAAGSADTDHAGHFRPPGRGACISGPCPRSSRIHPYQEATRRKGYRIICPAGRGAGFSSARAGGNRRRPHPQCAAPGRVNSPGLRVLGGQPGLVKDACAPLIARPGRGRPPPTFVTSAAGGSWRRNRGQPCPGVGRSRPMSWSFRPAAARRSPISQDLPCAAVANRLGPTRDGPVLPSQHPIHTQPGRPLGWGPQNDNWNAR